MRKIFIIMIFELIKGQPIDLSIPWESSESYYFSNQLENAIENNVAVLPNIGGLLIVKDGEIIYENYYNGGFQEEVFHIFSATKSFLSTLIGQAYDMDLIPNPSLPLSQFLEEDIDYLNIITLENLLTMTSGYIPLNDFLNATTYELANMSYWIGPGTFFYQEAATHLISHVLFHNTNMTPYEFADTHLFPYLGILNPFWYSGWNDINNGGTGLYLNLRDMSKLGQLYLQDGYSGEHQILSSYWVEEATSKKVITGFPPLGGYGYLFWVPDMQNTYLEGSFLVFGFGGQYVFVSPRHNLLVATHSYLYPDDGFQFQETLFLSLWDHIFPIFKLGDLNSDTIINIFDLIHLADNVFDMVDYNDSSDINTDGVVDGQDVIALMQVLLVNDF